MFFNGFGLNHRLDNNRVRLLGPVRQRTVAVLPASKLASQTLVRLIQIVPQTAVAVWVSYDLGRGAVEVPEFRPKVSS